ncbi:MAG TPA: dTDP-4-dehydrorhamnose reductase [Sphingomicrobium sp.]|nr:dTDP-4-dehydrorhamnose reductase [Sphingomicrobium sp.]
MKLLVTGRKGQLSRSLFERSAGRKGIELVAAGRPEVDLESPGSLAAAIRAIAPDVVVNAAAYTAVDQAEDEPDRAFRVNADAAGEAAAAAHEVGAAIIQISTDYVFDGRSQERYREDAATNPLGVYGASKLAGEVQVRVANPDHLILRTAWVYSPFRHNFVKTMLRLATDRDQVSVIADQWGTPTSALDIADAILTMLDSWSAGERKGIGTTLHVAARGTCSWAEFATEIFRASVEAGGPSASVRPISSAEYPTKARRPANSALDSARFETMFSSPLPHRRLSLPLVVARLVKSERNSGSANEASSAAGNRAN